MRKTHERKQNIFVIKRCAPRSNARDELYRTEKRGEKLGDQLAALNRRLLRKTKLESNRIGERGV